MQHLYHGVIKLCFISYANFPFNNKKKKKNWQIFLWRRTTITAFAIRHATWLDTVKSCPWWKYPARLLRNILPRSSTKQNSTLREFTFKFKLVTHWVWFNFCIVFYLHPGRFSHLMCVILQGQHIGAGYLFWGSELRENWTKEGLWSCWITW